LMGLFSLELTLARRIKPLSPKKMWSRAGTAQKLAAVYFLVSLVSTVLSEYPVGAVFGMSRREGLLTLGIYSGCFLCVSVFGKPSRRLLYMFGISMTVFCVICILQFKGLDPFDLFPGELTYLDADILYPGVYIGTIGNADHAASLLCIAIPLFMWPLLKCRCKTDILLLPPLALCLYVLFKLDVKSGILGICVGTVFSLAEFITDNKKIKKYLRSFVVVLVVAALITVYFAPMQGFLYEMQQVMHGNWNDVFGSGRIYIWKSVMALVPERLLFGHGPDTMLAAGIPGYDFHAPAVTVPTVVDAAHNEYLNILYHQGLFGVVTYLAFLISIGVKCFTSRSSTSAAALAGSAICCMIQAFFGISVCYAAGLFWIILALLEKTYKRGNENERSETTA